MLRLPFPLVRLRSRDAAGGLPAGLVGEPADSGPGGALPPGLPDTASSRYEAARGRARDRYGSLASQVHWLKGALLLLLLADGVLAYELARVAGQAEVIPFVILADPRTGRLDPYGPLEGLLRPEPRYVMAQLQDFVVNARTVYPDVIAQRDHVGRAYAFTAGAGAAVLDEYLASDEGDPYRLGRRMIRRVEPTGVARVEGTDNWDVDWTETDIPIGGFGAPCRRDWRARMRVRLDPPKTVQEFRRNLLGVYVTTLNWWPRTRCTPLAGGPPAAPAPARASSAGTGAGYGGAGVAQPPRGR